MVRRLRYPIIEIKCVAVKYGESLLTTIQDPEDVDKHYRVYLSKSYANVFSNEKLDKLYRSACA